MGEEGDCSGKNISALRQVSGEPGDDHSRQDVQPVDAAVHRAPDGQFSYLLKSTAGRPYIRFTVPGKLLYNDG